MNDPEFEAAGTPRKKSKAFPWLIGCSITMLVVGGLCVGGAYYAYHRLIDFVHDGFAQMIEESGLPTDQVASMKTDLDRLRDAVVDGDVDWSQFEALEEELERVVTLGVLQWYETEVLSEVELPEEERAEGRRTVQRFARGVQEGTLDPDDLRRFDLEVDEETREKGWDPEEVRRNLAAMKAAVDEAGVPDEPFQADVAAEFTALVDGLIETP